MLIGELAAEAGTTTRALRYYEEQGLLESGRTAAGYRVYEPAATLRVRNIRVLLACGFTVEDVKSFLDHLDAELPEVFCHAPPCAASSAVAARRVAELEERIAALTRLRDSLVHRMPWLAGPGDTAGEQVT
ncbi:MerR family transcriptional regulator [Nonomuraea pusilla]|uniref:DNA-binding transcriptional regulator, MerR family n=1 Tax=Nonomuraea pusilla TaxID=46177 RepID=A0A1H7TCU4_9ACTN|nr:MerR family transcriptional regulator [Nonomuraea pusilla]SEL82690.1 DNA-binding transcriptional regulator, MerR family [Nonomuraea pusilla]